MSPSLLSADHQQCFSHRVLELITLSSAQLSPSYQLHGVLAISIRDFWISVAMSSESGPSLITWREEELRFRHNQSYPSIVSWLHSFPADRASLVIDIPLFNAGKAVGVSAWENHIRLPLQANATLLKWGAFEQGWGVESVIEKHRGRDEKGPRFPRRAWGSSAISLDRAGRLRAVWRGGGIFDGCSLGLKRLEDRQELLESEQPVGVYCLCRSLYLSCH